MTDDPQDVPRNRVGSGGEPQDSLYNRIGIETRPEQGAVAQASNPKPEIAQHHVKNLGAIEELQTPADFKLSSKVERATGYTYTWSPDTSPQLTFSVSSRSQALNDNYADAFKTLLDKPPGTDVSGEIQTNPALQGALRERADKNAFTVTSATIREIEGRRVLSLTGKYNTNGHDTEMILIDQNGDGKFVQEIAYTGPSAAFRRYSDAAGKAMDSLNLK